MLRRAEDRWFERYRRTRDPRALARVFDRTAPRLTGLALHLTGDAHRAEDLVQSTFLTAIEKADTHRAEDSVSAWLLGILANRARYLQRQERRPIEPDRLGGEGGISRVEGPLESAQARELQAKLRAEVRALREPYRQVLLLHLEHGLSARQIADVVGSAPGTVRSQISRGLELLRIALPAGIAFGLFAQPSLAAARRAVLEQAALHAAPATAAALPLVGSALVMKKAIVTTAIGAALGATWWFWPGGDAVEGAHPPEQVEIAATTPTAPPPRAIESIEEGDVRSAVPSSSARTESAAESSGELIVQVRWSDGTPGAHLKVVARAEGASETLTGSCDARGRAHLKELPPGEYALAITRAGGEHTSQEDLVDLLRQRTRPGEAVAGDRAGRRSARVVAGERTEVALDVPKGVLVRATVRDADGGVPGGIEVWLRAEPGRRTGAIVGQAGVDGTFELRDVPPGSLVAARARGFAACVPAEVQAEPGQVVDLELVLEHPSGRLRGRVEDADGRAVAGASLQIGFDIDIGIYSNGKPLRNPPPIVLTTDRSGQFVSDHVPLRGTVVTVQSPAFAPWERAVEADAGIFDELLVVLSSEASLVGTVRDDRGEPIAGASVWANRSGVRQSSGWRHTTSAADGSFRLETLAQGEYDVSASGDGFPDLRTKLSFEMGELKTWNPVLQRGLGLHGQLVDEAGEPLARFRIRLQQPQGGESLGPVVTDAAGRFAFTGCRSEPYDVQVYEPDSDGHFHLFHEPAVMPSDELLTVVLPAAARRTAQIVGRLARANGGVLPRVRIWLLRRPFSGGPMYYSDGETGEFVIPKLPADAYRVVAVVPDRPQRDLGTHELTPGQTLDLGTVVLQETSGFDLTLVAPDGTPAESGSVQVCDTTGDVRAGSFFRDGQCSIEPLEAGTYSVRAWGRDFPFTQREVELLPGERAQWTWQAPESVPRRIVFVKPTEDYDLELETITFQAVGGDVFWTDSGGRWPGTMVAEIERAFPPGEYRVAATSTDGLTGEATLRVSASDEPGTLFEVQLR